MRKILSGGHSLISLMQFRLATPPFLVDINRIPGLDIGAVTSDEIAASIHAELVQVRRQHIAPPAAEFAQAVAAQNRLYRQK